MHPPIAVLGATHVDLLQLYRHKLWQIYRKLIEKIIENLLTPNNMGHIPHICHFFTQAKFLENKIYTEIYTVNCQFFALNL